VSLGQVGNVLGPRKVKVPKYGLHKPTGKARIVIHGRSIYLGDHGSPESYERYARWVTKLGAEAKSEPDRRLQLPTAGIDQTINELLVRYLHHADEYYRWNAHGLSSWTLGFEAGDAAQAAAQVGACAARTRWR